MFLLLTLAVIMQTGVACIDRDFVKQACSGGQPPCIDKRSTVLHSLSTFCMVVIHRLSIKGPAQAFGVSFIRARSPYSHTHSPVSHIRTHKSPRQERNSNFAALVGLKDTDATFFHVSVLHREPWFCFSCQSITHVICDDVRSVSDSEATDT